MAKAAPHLSACPKAIRRYAERVLGLNAYLRAPGDGRTAPILPASDLLWAQVMGYLLRESSFRAMEGLSCSGAGRAMGLSRRFGDDALAYFTERLDPTCTRGAMAGMLRRMKRNKVFAHQPFIGLALDGTGVARCSKARCPLCIARRDAKGAVTGYRHALVAISVVGGGLCLPFDAEPYGPGDCEYNAGQRLMRRAVEHLGKRFATHMVVDGEFATAPFLHGATQAGLHVIARLKDNLPELNAQARARFEHSPPHRRMRHGTDVVELWDADDFDPWETLNWPTVRVLRYRQHKQDGSVIEAYWLTDFPPQRASAPALYQLAKARWEIENQGFNDAKNRYGFKHMPHHHENSLLIHWLLVFLAMCIERLYRLRYLHRGAQAPLSAIDFLRRLRLTIGRPAPRAPG